MTAVVAVACGNELGESAAWSVREQRLYWVDIRAPALHAFEPATGDHIRWPLPEICAAVVPAITGVLLALRRTLAHFDPRTARLTRVAEVESESSGNRLNEMKCDRQGRLWVGSMRDFGEASSGALYRIDASSRATRVLADVTIPNGLGWSPNGDTMYFADTRVGAIDHYAYTDGRVGVRDTFVPADALPGVPDGGAVDAQGHMWTTRFGAGLVVRVSPDGRESGRIALPVSQPTSCALGGDDLSTLFVTTARQRLSAEALAEQPSAGHLFAVRVSVPGLPETDIQIPEPDHEE